MTRTVWMVALMASGVLAACGGETSADPNVIEACAAKGKPVTIAKLVRVFRANGITLDVSEFKCKRPASPSSDATNGGPSGSERREGVVRVEGYVLCDVGRRGVLREDRRVHVVKYPTDRETHLDALNVSCSAYPYDAESEREQVARVESALRELIRLTPTN